MPGFGAPGAYLSSNNRFAQLLQSMPDSNNGTVAGGLGSVLQKALMGYIMGQEARDQKAGQQTMGQAIQAMQGTPEQTIQFTTPRPDGTGDMTQAVPAVPGNRSLAMQLLASNPNTAPLAFQLSAADAQRAAQLSDAKDLALFKAKNQPQKPGVDVPFSPEVAAQQLEIANAKRARIPVPGVDYPLPPDVAAQKQEIAANRGGQFYAVPTGSGMLILDKKTGMAQRMGQDEQGNMVPLGQPFMPTAGAPDTNGGPLPTPVLPPSVDAAAQGAVAREKASNAAIGKVQGTAEAGMPNATQSKDYVLGLINDLSNDENLDKATGFYSYLPTLPGVNAEVRSKIDQLQGQNFLQAYQGLRGGGQITEVEGKKAQEAQARLNTAQTTQEFKAALKDMADLVKQRYTVQQQQAGKTNSSAPAEYDYVPGQGLVPRNAGR